ncbi:hypothetical protein RRG08_023776 [Elysia crispata]|uniref:Uncharacterized protein n=1 Tax=Elysia crispata TaxID=231223 RepID=A0AAE0ZVI8_9GAST|nr:hypothetical protein RRG08_023776 [Elysia crispata]
MPPSTRVHQHIDPTRDRTTYSALPQSVTTTCHSPDSSEGLEKVAGLKTRRIIVGEDPGCINSVSFCISRSNSTLLRDL